MYSCRSRIDHRVKQLTEGLMSELQVSPERSLRGGPRAARRAVAQLIRLGKSAQVRVGLRDNSILCILYMKESKLANQDLSIVIVSYFFSQGYFFESFN